MFPFLLILFTTQQTTTTTTTTNWFIIKSHRSKILNCHAMLGQHIIGDGCALCSIPNLYDPLETRLLESEVEAEEQTNHKVWSEAL